MKTILLRETYDNNIKEIFRLRQLSTGQTVFTASKFGECDSNIKSLQKPIFAHIRVTSKCNLNCPYCYANDNTNKEDMSDQLLLELVDICNQNDILCITWTGGEPLIRKGFYSVVMKAYAHRIKQTILTNGTLLQKVVEQHWPQDNIDFQISLNEVWNNRESVKCSVENAEMLIKNGYAVVVTIMLEPVGIEEYKNLFEGTGIPIDIIAGLLTAGTYYLILHRKRSTFFSVDYQRKENRERLYSTLEYLSGLVFSALKEHNQTIEIARNFKQKGIADDVIAECTGLSVDVVKGL